MRWTAAQAGNTVQGLDPRACVLAYGFYALCLLYETVLFCSIICLSARAIYVLFIAGVCFLFVEGNFTMDEGIARIAGFIHCPRFIVHD